MTTRSTDTARSAALLTALALVLAGCSSNEAPEATASPTAEHVGPLWEYLAPVTEHTTGEEVARARNVKYEEGIATCMAEAGFDYVPHAVPLRTVIPASDEGTRDWVARRGYGLSGGRMEGPELAAMAAENEANAALTQLVNPNDAIYAQLSEGTKAAYDLALYGPQPSGGDERDDSTPWSRADGCLIWTGTVLSAEENAFYADYMDLLDRISAIQRDLNTQPRMVELTTAWSHCMADAGHVYTSPTHAQDSVYAVIQGSPVPGDPYVTSDEAKALEIAVALADYDCQASVSWDEVRNEVIDEVEAQFLKDNRAEIDEYIDYVTQNPPWGS